MEPDDLRYTEHHAWVARSGEATVRIGITDYAQSQLGEIVSVQLPECGDTVTAGAPLGVVESSKAATEIDAPLSGEIVAVNDMVAAEPEMINNEPYGDGWLVEVRLGDPASPDGLLDAASYREKIGAV
ncbi:glycine cleavage system protein GcvH [Streptomyces sp. NPDC049555]|uniref:glycine cleavage system protein GcvH n=1 Tax=Streptomyces sp. NPDC049555 TaxID=3154930 RepID=UPI00342ED5C4